MPYPNEHAARLVDPEKFDPDSFRRVNDKFGDGIHAIFGKLKGEDSMTLQAVRFDADKFTAEEAKKWLKGHDYDPIEFEEAGSQKALSYFVPLAKADEAKREVWGTAAIEQPDASGEIMFQYPPTDRGNCNVTVVTAWFVIFFWFQYPLTDRGNCNLKHLGATPPTPLRFSIH